MKRDHILYIIIALFVLSTMLFPSKCYAENKTITFTWEQEISPDFAGWELYYSKDPNASFVLLKDIKLYRRPKYIRRIGDIRRAWVDLSMV